MLYFLDLGCLQAGNFWRDEGVGMDFENFLFEHSKGTMPEGAATNSLTMARMLVGSEGFRQRLSAHQPHFVHEYRLVAQFRFVVYTPLTNSLPAVRGVLHAIGQRTRIDQ